MDSFKHEDRSSLGCEVKLYLHEGRYCNDIMIESMYRDQTVSWVRIVNGINKYVTETSEEIPSENINSSTSTGKLVAKAKPKPRSVVNSNVNVPILERKRIDVDPQPFDRCCFEVSKIMTRTLRHDSFNSSRRRRSSETLRSDREIEGRIW